MIYHRAQPNGEGLSLAKMGEDCVITSLVTTEGIMVLPGNPAVFTATGTTWFSIKRREEADDSTHFVAWKHVVTISLRPSSCLG